MEIALFIIGFIQLIVLITFFKMVNDVEALRIRFVSTKPEGWLTKFYKSKALKRDAEALYNIQEYVWLSIQSNKNKKNYEKLAEQWSDTFKELNSEFPTYPF